MIVTRDFRLARIAPYVWRETLFVALVAGATGVTATMLGPSAVALPFAPLGVLGTALAILLGFRNNTGYARWWEGRTLWGNGLASSRALARQVITAVENAHASGKGGSREDGEQYQREIVYRLIAFAHAMRLWLRRERDWSALESLLPAGEAARLAEFPNRPFALLLALGRRLKDGVRTEQLGTFDPISIEPSLAGLHAWHAGCERLKDTPLLRQYDYFTRCFLWTFLALLPPSLLGAFPGDATPWRSSALAVVIGIVYALTHKVGEVTEDPFEHRVQDVPMTALCRSLERELRSALGESSLPPELHEDDGYLF